MPGSADTHGATLGMAWMSVRATSQAAPELAASLLSPQAMGSHRRPGPALSAAQAPACLCVSGGWTLGWVGACLLPRASRSPRPLPTGPPSAPRPTGSGDQGAACLAWASAPRRGGCAAEARGQAQPPESPISACCHQ